MPNNLTDAEIKKALECCGKPYNVCAECPLPNDIKDDCKCGEHLANYALDLINRQEAENKKFKDRQKPTGASGYKIENGKVVFFTNMLGGCKIVKENLEEVVKTLNELLQECYSKDEIAFALKCKTEELKTAKAEAYKECLEKVEQRDVSESDFYIMVKKTEFDNLLKELVGDANETR